MIASSEFPFTPTVREELRRLANSGSLEPINNQNNIGLMRDRNGNTDLSALNSNNPNSRIKPFVLSPFLAELSKWFVRLSESHLGDEFVTQAYAGITTDGGILTYPHCDSGIRTRLSLAIADSETNASTLFLSDIVHEEDLCDLPPEIPQMESLLKRLGRSAFSQARMGQIAWFGPTERHGEMPLPAGTPKILMTSSTYQEA
ncbi:MAG TPA: hypothetical protein VMR18_00190 [Candidatus Saccharimonadales bacterium]|nr:hypothetical protein [Candidatus Saccharimonadales bacterium]